MFRLINKLLTFTLIAIILLQGLMLRNCYFVINDYNANISEYFDTAKERSEELKVINEKLEIILGDEIERCEE